MTFEEARVAAPNAPVYRTPRPERCTELSSRRRDFGAAGLGAGILGTGLAVAGLPGKDSDVKRIYLGAAAVSGGLAVTSWLIAEHAGDRWVAEGCGF